MFQFNLEQIFENLQSSNLEKQIDAIVEAAKVANVLAEAVVNSLALAEEESQRFLIAERLTLMGTLAIPYLQKLLMTSNNPSVKTLASLVLLQAGSTLGVEWLLEISMENTDYTCLVIRHLNKRNLIEIDQITKRLEQCDNSETHLIVCLVGILTDKNVKLPLDLQRRLLAPEMAWAVRHVVQENISLHV